MRRPLLPASLSLTLSLLAAAVTLPAQAASSAVSSASDSITTSVGSISASVQKSSNSSSQTTKLAAGEYRVIDVALNDASGLARIRLHAEADPSADGELDLLVPQATVAQAGLKAGEVLTAAVRPYGFEFTVARADKALPFFLVLEDDWYRELQTRPVTL